MKILIFSDTHGEINKAIDIIKKENPDKIIHLGDFLKDALDISCVFNNIEYIKGNNDFNCEYTDNKVISINNINIFICHGHNFNVNQNINDVYKASMQNNCTVALYGHTHISKKVYINDILILNPGSITSPRDGFSSYGVLEIINENLFAKIVKL